MNIDQLLHQLAEKLGTTVERLWSVIIQQAFIDALSNIVMLLMFIYISEGWRRFIVRKTTKPSLETAPWRYSRDKVQDSWIGWGILATITILLTVFTFTSIITGLTNPEYRALTQILNRI